MRFGPTPLSDAEGAILAHSLRIDGASLRKGRTLSAADIEKLAAAGVGDVITARLGSDDVPEDLAAERIANAVQPALSDAELSRSAPFTGRANLFAAGPGLFRISRALVDAVNAVDPSITIATLEDATWVAPRQMTATVKIIPYAAPGSAVRAVEGLLAEAEARDRPRVAAPLRLTAGLVLTRTPGMKPSLVEKGAEAIRDRVEALGVTLAETVIVDHETGALASALMALKGDVALILAGSATSDPEDVAPAAIRAAGGEVLRVGMPVDPGNLLVLGQLGDRPALGLPGCARSPARNGADTVLERIICGEPVDSALIAGMGVGGLLKEIPSRPSPRLPARAATPEKPFVSAVLLAAGGSSRMGKARHKLLEQIDGAPLVRRAAERLLAAQLDEVVVVLGARSDEIRTALEGLAVRFVTAPDWRSGQAASLAAGLSALSPRAGAVLVALGDMPDIEPALVDRLLAGFDPDERREIIRPRARSGRPGHPVLFGRRFFEALTAIIGDEGARSVIAAHPEYLVEIEAGSDAPLIDLDTPEDWARYRARAKVETD